MKLILLSSYYYLVFILFSQLSGTVLSVPVELSLDANYQLKWNVESDEKEEIIFEVTAYTPGYAGFGISETGGMRGADIVVITILPDGTLELKDMHGTGNREPVLDRKQDYHLLASNVSGSFLWAKFSRKIDTCDSEDVKITEGTLHIIWSYGETSNHGSKIEYHGGLNRGSRAANFLDPVYEVVNTSMYKTWPLHQDIILTKERTLYWCKFHKVSDLGKKHHIVGFGIYNKDDTGKRHAHHGSILSCTAPPGVQAEDFFDPFVNDVGYDCYFHTETPSPPIKNCKHFDFQWAYGGTPTMFPPNVGVPFGESTKYYMTMMHLDNPERIPGIHFKTGFELYYTDKLREFDAGFFQIGINSTKAYSLTIPPNSTNYVLSSHCPSFCTTGLPKDGISVFMYLLHFHLTGRKMGIRHFQGGNEVPWLANDENYDTNYQNNRMLRKPVTILPGDHLTVECTYDSTDRNGSVVIGGRGLLDEMCQAFLMYYPKVSVVNRCGSGFSQAEMLNFMGIRNVTLPEGGNDPIVLEPVEWEGRRYTDVVEHEVSWTREKRWNYQLLTQRGYQETECTQLGPGVKRFSKYPSNFKKYEPPKGACEGIIASDGIQISANYKSCLIIVFKLLYAFEYI